MNDTKGYQVFKNVADPESDQGQEIIRKLLGETGVKFFPFTISGRRSADYHTVDCVVCIDKGDLVIGFGKEYTDEVRVGKGDLLFIKKNAPHLEHPAAQ